MARILGGRWIKGPPVSTISIENSRKKKLWEVPAMFLRPKKIKERISLLPFPGFRSKLTLQNENYHIETPERELFVETNWQPTEFFDRKIPFPSSISSPNPCQRRESVRDP